MQTVPTKPRLTVAQILTWADKHRRRAGDWPTVLSGPVPEAPGLTWAAVDKALRDGRRGLPGGDSLPRLLRRERGGSARRGGRPDTARRREAARLRAAGLTLAEVGRRLGVTKQAVIYLLRKAARDRKQP
jgi:hypothetical protein